ncbi:putative Outer membrane protein, OMP85 family [Desulfamplus magnetovallimortis]|uniref:Putative Outer membrane protein, OMP85 family n=1 Tax=Desulfamplus magnetovallimortis TaxID=1246637 RepID=A0A1W1HI49_9BACT|nr:ShlB/FhaC/HecB family hemolysin secretion/activation protein [Desulfamplus magnetovallimortis]SLM32120.1 putative Outer membrane protein, OMP85 family [Desulfamplus magnetovallimortis]
MIKRYFIQRLFRYAVPFLYCTLFFCCLCFSTETISQERPSLDSTDSSSRIIHDLNKPSSKVLSDIPDYLPEKQEKNFTLPPVAPPKEKIPAGGVSFLLSDITIEGNTVFSTEELKKEVQSFFNTSVTIADLEEIRYRLTRFYVDHGYVNSGALIKQRQKVTNGVVEYLVIEARLDEITIKGNKRLWPEYIKKRIWPDAQTPFNTLKLQEYFQMLLQDPLVERMDGKILPGPKAGDALLEIDLTRALPYEINMSIDNHSSPNLGSDTVSVNNTIRNITGFGDTLALNVGFTEGTQEIDAAFSLPLTPQDTMLTLSYTSSENDLITNSMKELGIRSELDSMEISLMHPLYRSLSRNFKVGLSLKKEESQTFMSMHGDDPFAFSEGDYNGKNRATVIRLIQSFQERSSEQIFALRSTFNIGVDMFDPTVHSESLPDGLFLSWLGQIQYGRRLGEKAGQIILSGDLQIADDRLPSMEQFSVGGASSVRGYRENEHIGDNGYRLSLEWRIPVWESTDIENKNSGKGNYLLQMVPFVDYGSAWDREHFGRTKNSEDNTLLSTGLGLVWTGTMFNAEIYYGYAIEDADEEADYNLQDDGIHFKVTCNFK